MNVVDHAILITSPSDVVWSIVGSIEDNWQWQVDCDRVAFITGNHRGIGTRWRCYSNSGKEYVMEVTAWYDNLGYEYKIVDGAPYQQNSGRIRLQETPDGTLVQWTFSYEMGGILGGLRNSLGKKQAIRDAITDGLRNLYQYTLDKAGSVEFNPKTLMRDAPDVEQRSQYKPRHPSVVENEAKTGSEPEIGVSVQITEPPVTDNDTHPSPAVEISHEALVSAPRVEPATPALVAPAPVEPVSQGPGEAMSLSESEPEPQAAVTEPVKADQASKADDDPDKRKLDTANISVFEVFGLTKPSETQELQAIRTTTGTTRDLETAPTAEESSDSPSASSPAQVRDTLEHTSVSSASEVMRTSRRTGLRASQRACTVKLRPPAQVQSK